MNRQVERTMNYARERIPHLVNRGRRVVGRSIHQASRRVSRRGRAILEQSARRTERATRRRPWLGLGVAFCTGLAVTLAATLILRGRR